MYCSRAPRTTRPKRPLGAKRLPRKIWTTDTLDSLAHMAHLAHLGRGGTGVRQVLREIEVSVGRQETEGSRDGMERRERRETIQRL